MIELKNIYFKYKANKSNEFILNDLNLTIKQGEFISIIGNNGEGKSSLVKLLSGLILPTQGDILINNLNTKSKKDFTKIRQTVSVVFQNPENQIIFERVYEELEFTLKNLKVPQENIEKQIDYALKTLNMFDYKFTNTSELSLGQKQKIIIAEAISTNSEIIILDEPTAMLDPSSKKEILNILKELNNQGKTIILVTHLLDELFYSNRCLYLNNKKIENNFIVSELFNKKNIKLLKKINKNDSNFTLKLLNNLIENNITINFDTSNKTITLEEYLNNKLLELIQKNITNTTKK